MDNPDLKFLVGFVVVVLLGIGAWYYWDELVPPPEPTPVVEAVAPAEPVSGPGPQHPIPELQAGLADASRLVPLPPLDDSDAYLLLEIGATFGSAIESLLVRDAVIDRMVTTIDNLPRRQLAEKIRPVGRLEKAFAADTGTDSSIVLGPSSYLRYDALVAYIYYADLDAVYDTYRRFYPLFQKSYERLGYPDAYFNDRLVEVIDHLVATPIPEEPIVLVRPNVLYEFADPDLESLSSGQKLLLRMGPSNAGTIKRLLEKFRSRVTSG